MGMYSTAWNTINPINPSTHPDFFWWKETTQMHLRVEPHIVHQICPPLKSTRCSRPNQGHDDIYYSNLWLPVFQTNHSIDVMWYILWPLLRSLPETAWAHICLAFSCLQAVSTSPDNIFYTDSSRFSLDKFSIVPQPEDPGCYLSRVWVDTGKIDFTSYLKVPWEICDH